MIETGARAAAFYSVGRPGLRRDRWRSEALPQQTVRSRARYRPHSLSWRSWNLILIRGCSLALAPQHRHSRELRILAKIYLWSLRTVTSRMIGQVITTEY